MDFCKEPMMSGKKGTKKAKKAADAAASQQATTPAQTAAKKRRAALGDTFLKSPLWLKILLGVIVFVILIISWKIIVWVFIALLLANIAIRLAGFALFAGLFWMAFLGWLLVGGAFLWPSSYVADAIYHQSTIPVASPQSAEPAGRELAAPVEETPAPAEVLFVNFATTESCGSYIAKNQGDTTVALFVTSDASDSFGGARIFVATNQDNTWGRIEEVTKVVGTKFGLGDYTILISGGSISAEQGAFSPWLDSNKKILCLSAAQVQQSIK
jgi:hypothetical protein